MQEIRLKALGKINLALDVLRRREDGYHEVRMIMQTVNMYDKLTLRKKKEPGIEVKTNLFYLPTNENNLVYKAAKLLMDEAGIEQGLFIDLHKFIPVAAGMAGGSSDAAAVLYGVNRLFNLGLSQKDLMERGVRIGADVPYCVMRGTALAEGIGEKLTPLPPMPDCYILIAKPGISISTKSVYQNLRLDTLEKHQDTDRSLRALEEGNLMELADSMGNVLESVTIRENPVIEEIKDEMKAAGAINAMMSGSGPTVFGIFTHKNKAEEAERILQKKGLAKQTYITKPYNNRSYR